MDAVQESIPGGEATPFAFSGLALATMAAYVKGQRKLRDLGNKLIDNRTTR